GSGTGMLIYGPGDSAAPAQEPEKTAQKSDAKKGDNAKDPPQTGLTKAKSEPNIPQPTPLYGQRRAAQFIDRLADTVNSDGFDNAKFTLQDALDYLTERYDLAFSVDDAAFRAAGLKNSVLGEFVAI